MSTDKPKKLALRTKTPVRVQPSCCRHLRATIHFHENGVHSIMIYRRGENGRWVLHEGFRRFFVHPRFGLAERVLTDAVKNVLALADVGYEQGMTSFGWLLAPHIRAA